MRAAAVAAVVLAACATAAGCGDEGARADAQDRPAPGGPLVLDERTGAYRGVGIGSTAREVRRRLGRTAARGGRNAAFTPTGADFYRDGGPTSFGGPDQALTCRRSPEVALRYVSVSFVVECARVFAIYTVEAGARTRGGVAVGDDRDRVREVHPGARCYTANEGTEWATFPLCEVLLRPGLRLYFGADPIRSIMLVASGNRAYRALARQRRR